MSGGGTLNSIHDDTSRRRWRTRLGGFAVGAVLAGLCVAAYAATRSDDADPHGPDTHELSEGAASAATDLMAALSRSMEVSFVGSGVYERRSFSGEQLVVDLTGVIQSSEPRQRLTLGFGVWSGVVDGTETVCEGDGFGGNWVECSAEDAADLSERDRRRLEGVERFVAEPDEPYRVSEIDRVPPYPPAVEGSATEKDELGASRCFLARLVGDTRFLPDLGSQSVWCFDADGVEVFRRVVLQDAYDVATIEPLDVDPLELLP